MNVLLHAAPTQQQQHKIIIIECVAGFQWQYQNVATPFKCRVVNSKDSIKVQFRLGAVIN